jgi:hypothetical protein
MGSKKAAKRRATKAAKAPNRAASVPFTESEERHRFAAECTRPVAAVTTPAGEEYFPRIRVSWQGCISVVDYAGSPLVESPPTAILGRDFVPRFAQSGMGFHELLVSGLGLGGSRALSGARPRRLYHGISSDSTQARCGPLFTTSRMPDGTPAFGTFRATDDARAWSRGSVQETCRNDAIARIGAMRFATQEVRDAAHCRAVCLRSVSRSCRPGAIFCDDPAESTRRCILAQSSQWALFYGVFYSLLNTMASKSVRHFCAATGFTRLVTPAGGLEIARAPNNTRLQRAVTDVAGVLAQLVRVVTGQTPCCLQPWTAVVFFPEHLRTIEAALDQGTWARRGSRRSCPPPRRPPRRRRGVRSRTRSERCARP